MARKKDERLRTANANDWKKLGKSFNPKYPRKIELVKFSTESEISKMIASKLMQKMGWKPGQGIGKNNQGRVHSIVGSIKNNNNGIGVYDALATSWEDMFNKAAKSIRITSSKSKTIEIKMVEEEKPNNKGYFVKSSAKEPETIQDQIPSKSRKYMYQKRMSGKLKRLTDFDSGKNSNVQVVLDALEEKKKHKKSLTVMKSPEILTSSSSLSKKERKESKNRTKKQLVGVKKYRKKEMKNAKEVVQV